MFISHAHDDRRLAAELLALLQAALPLTDKEIRCTSGDGSGLPGGAQIDENLRRDVRDAEVLIGVVSERSVQSSYVLFEMGARWGANTYMVPVLAPGERATILPGPLPGRIALRLDNDRQVNQCVREIAERLGLAADTGPKYVSHRTRLAHIRPSRARDTAAQLSAIIRKLKTESAELKEQIKALEDASWRPLPTVQLLSLSASFDEKGSGVQVRRWAGIRASEPLLNKKIPYQFAVAKPKGKASLPDVSEIANPRSQLDVVFRPKKLKKRDPSRAEGEIELLGTLTRSTRFVGFEITQKFERAFYMTRKEMVNAYANDKWKTEYISVEIDAPTK